MKSFRIIFIAAFLAFAMGAFGHAALAGKNADTPAAKFVQGLGDKALNSLTAHDIPEAERQRRVRALLAQYFDVKTIGRFVLGPHWRDATDAQRGEYQKLFENMIVRTYSQRFAEYSGQSFKVLGSTPPKGDSSDTIVNSQILQKDGPPVDVDWRVRDKGGSMKIVDVYVDQISMSVTQRNDFDSVIQEGGGKFDALLVSLRRHQGGKAG